MPTINFFGLSKAVSLRLRYIY